MSLPRLRSDWERDPFTPVVENGFLFGRGSSDNKFGIVTMVATLLWLKAEGFKPSRDILLALTGDEETTQAYDRRPRGADQECGDGPEQRRRWRPAR